MFLQFTPKRINQKSRKENTSYYFCRDRSQRSRPVRLRGGRVYFVEVVMKEGGGGDHVSVGVRKPRSRGVKPISKRDLYRQRPSKKLLLLIFSLSRLLLLLWLLLSL